MNKVKMLEFQQHGDDRGHLVVVEGNQLKVIYPQSLADRISQMALDTLKMYGIEVGNIIEK